MRVHAKGAIAIGCRRACGHRLEGVVQAVQVISIQIAARRERAWRAVGDPAGFDDSAGGSAANQRSQEIDGTVDAVDWRLHRDGQRLHHLHRQRGAIGKMENEVAGAAVGHFAIGVHLDRLEKRHVPLQLSAHRGVAPLRLRQLQPEGVNPGPTGVQVSRTRVLGQVVDQRITTRAAVKAVAAGPTVDDVVAST